MNNIGSEWAKWDLHFHTPSSHDYGDKTVTNQDIVDVMSSRGIAAFAVTDHHVIDIDRVKDLQRLGKEKNITVLPGIEFLSDARGGEAVHFIGIFAEDSNIAYIWGQLENQTNIKDIKGKSRKPDEVYCDLADTIQLVKSLGGIISIHAGQKSGSIENITNSLPHSMAQKTDIAYKVDIYELGKESDQEGYRKHVFPFIKKIIPMIICSDNHNIKKYILKQNLWIKGNSNFAGLKYALNEPEDRFFIGFEPEVLKRVRDNKTKYIDKLTIKLTGAHDPSNIWFEDINIPLNKELVTIIGNKGSGKSAVSDIISLCSDGDHSEDYLFLHRDKFKKKGLAGRYSASLTFGSGQTTPDRVLDYVIQQSDQRKVRYLPQSYFEKLCNEIGKVEAFREEIEKVVFQYVPIENRLRRGTFKELVDFKKDSVDKEISNLRDKVYEVNTAIIDLEDKANPEHKKLLSSKLRIKNEELTVHENSKPVAVADPDMNTSNPAQTERRAELQGWQDKKIALEHQLEAVKKEISEKSIAVSELQSIKRDLTNRVNDLINFVESNIEITSALGIDLDKVIKVDFNSETLDIKIVSIEQEISKKRAELEVDLIGDLIGYEELNLQSKYDFSVNKILEIQSKFSGDQKVYQDYLTALSAWQETRALIIGDADTPESLSALKAEINYINQNLETDLNRLRSERLEHSKEIFEKKLEIKSFYDEIKSAIDKQLSTSEVTGLKIVSSFYASSVFEEYLLREIKQNRSGSFYGLEDGKALLHNELVTPTDWNDLLSFEVFLTKFIDFLEGDKRLGQQNAKTYIGDIVRDRRNLYNYLFSLDYLEQHYDLQQNGKSLEQLSPGEKGALLLVFYLVLDKEDIPLIIDQPEDNLDNHSVAKILVPYIKQAKKKRQIILVTHNPNLAVVSDSEQVIRVKIDKLNGNKFEFISGGIEQSPINEAIVEVLEGTLPAFTTRRDKYLFPPTS
ncbi:TrlF family AAA-like ATPase [Methylotenera sp. 1P/1]|uniref:TrlF family AAA-like ATPase n=1 Tax=Methylotenera sp. 1P/1 TaxID=1131551 RepID=UPI000364FF95|nr:AAA family ATPase [Methylotenera sp. 1P/1]